MSVAEEYNIPDCPNCIYAPDFGIKRDDDWEWDETMSYKKRKPHKPFRCLYNGREITNWEEVKCPLKK